MAKKDVAKNKLKPITIIKVDEAAKEPGDFYEFHKGLIDQINNVIKNPKITRTSCCIQGCCVSWCCVQLH